MILARTGADVRVVATADELADAIRAFDPDVLVSDVGMPDEDGHTLLRRLRREIPDARFAAIALTAFAGRHSEHEARAAGFDGFLPKPTSVDALVRTVRAVVKRP